MTAAKRRIATTRKISLGDYGDDLADCYVVVTLADFEEVTKISETDVAGLSNIDATKMMLDTARKHFVAGKIRTLNDDGTSEVVDMEPRDISSSAALIQNIYMTVMGVTLDPKATQTAQPSKTEPGTDESSMNSTSSTTSQAESTQQ